MTMMMMKMTTLPLPQTWRTTSASAVNHYTQYSTFQAGDGNNVEEERWQKGRRHDGGQWTMDTNNGRLMKDDRRWTMDDGRWTTTMTNTTIKQSMGDG